MAHTGAAAHAARAVVAETGSLQVSNQNILVPMRTSLHES